MTTVFLLKNAIANATTLAEVERLKGLLQAGQIPGRDRKAGKEWPHNSQQGDHLEVTAGCERFHVNIIEQPAAGLRSQ